MLYADYMFEVNENGICFTDRHKDEMLTTEQTKLVVGETLTVQLDEFDRICLVRQHAKGNEGNFHS